MMKKIMLHTAKKNQIENGSQIVRLKFQKARQFLNPVNAVIQLGFSRSKNKGTAVGRAMSFTLHSAMEGTYPDITVNPANAKLSLGTKGVLTDVQIGRSVKSIRLTWDSTGSSGDMNSVADDRVLLCAYAVEQELAVINEEQVLRSAGQMNLRLPDGMQQLPVHLYLVVYDRSKRNCSDSQYLGLFN
ncbi:DUF6266 family protein [Sphingobacterium kitahiroshimense]|uniref:DUF6266 family protein n=1 Tax=Sphingobacterium kitahiroshimense TaxID=470446 RepID=A0ABV0C0D4_9SPHI